MRPFRALVWTVDAVAHVLIFGLDWFWARADAEVCEFSNLTSDD